MARLLFYVFVFILGQIFIFLSHEFISDAIEVAPRHKPLQQRGPVSTSPAHIERNQSTCNVKGFWEVYISEGSGIIGL